MALLSAALVDGWTSVSEGAEDESAPPTTTPRARERLDRASRASKETPCGPTPLVTAVEAGEPDVVLQLIKAGARLDETIAMGFSALHVAAAMPYRGGIVAALAAAGANIELAAEEGVTPLMAAAQHGHTEALIALLEAGADPNKPGEELCRPLHVRKHTLEPKMSMHALSRPVIARHAHVLAVGYSL